MKKRENSPGKRGYQKTNQNPSILAQIYNRKYQNRNKQYSEKNTKANIADSQNKNSDLGYVWRDEYGQSYKDRFGRKGRHGGNAEWDMVLLNFSIMRGGYIKEVLYMYTYAFGYIYIYIYINSYLDKYLYLKQGFFRYLYEYRGS